MRAIGARASFGELLATVGKLPTKRAECIAELEFVLLAVRDMILYKRDERCELCFFASREALEVQAEQFSLRRLFAVWDVLTRATSALSGNANLQLTLTAMCDELRAQ